MTYATYAKDVIADLKQIIREALVILKDCNVRVTAHEIGLLIGDYDKCECGHYHCICCSHYHGLKKGCSWPEDRKKMLLNDGKQRL